MLFLQPNDVPAGLTLARWRQGELSTAKETVRTSETRGEGA
jgi:hypothetical protein